MNNILGIIGTWLICMAATERAAEAITASEIFAPTRAFLARTALLNQRSVEKQPFGLNLICAVCGWLSQLVSCGWCTSFWSSLFFSFFLPGQYLSSDAGNNILVKAIALWGFANLYHPVFKLIHDGRMTTIIVGKKTITRLGREIIVDNYGGIDGESGEGISQEDTIGIESPKV